MLCKNKLSTRCITLYSIAMMALASGFSTGPSHLLPNRLLHPSVNTEAMKSSTHTKTTLPMTKEPNLPSLTEDTTWRLRFALNNVPTQNGRKVGELFVVHLQFIEEEGFEPPQGIVRQVFPDGAPESTDETGESSPNAAAPTAKITGGRWKLSEDPDDRKDGLWIWGLFKEPLYPFLLLQIETGAYPIDGMEGDCLKPLVLYAQVDHKRDKGTGEVELGVAALNLREIEQMKADPFGAAKVEVFEEVKVGQLTLRPYDAAKARK